VAVIAGIQQPDGPGELAGHVAQRLAPALHQQRVGQAERGVLVAAHQIQGLPVVLDGGLDPAGDRVGQPGGGEQVGAGGGVLAGLPGDARPQVGGLRREQRRGA